MIRQASDHEDLIEASQSCWPCPNSGTTDTRGTEFMVCACSGRIRKQDRGLIDLGCEPETKLRRTHDKGEGVRATPST